MSLPISISCVAAFGLMILSARGQTASATTSPVGAVSLGAFNTSTSAYIGLQSGSDTFVTLPLTRPPVFVGTTSAAPTGSTIPISGAPGWTTNQFVYASGSQTNTYYVLIGSNSTTSNPKEGCLYTITGNDASDLTIDLGGDTITSIPAGTTLTIIPFWTLGTLFPASNVNVSFTPTTLTRSLQTEVLVPDNSSAGINRAYANIYIYVKSGSNVGWRNTSDPTLSIDQSNVPFVPNSFFVVRNNSGTPSGQFVLTGNVLTGNVATPLMTQTSGGQDNDVAMIRPIGVTLANCGLNTADGSFVPTVATRSLKDELFLYDNNVAQINKPPSTIYIYAEGMWQNTATIGTNSNTDMLPAGAAIMIRKAATTTGSSVFWTNSPTY